MKTIRSWRDLQPFGITPLTGEACGLSYRLLCDVTEAGKQVLEKCLDAKLTLTDPWNRGAVGSIMLSQEMLVPLAIFALLESGCTEVWRNDDVLLGVESSDPPQLVERTIAGSLRRFAYEGTAGSRNVHQMTGRIL